MITRSRKRIADKQGDDSTVKVGEASEQSISEVKSEDAEPAKAKRRKPVVSSARKKSGNNFTRVTNSEKVWAEKMEALREFRAEHGHVNVPKTHEHKQLARFVNNQRQFYRKKMEGATNSLTDERVKALEELGFMWVMKTLSDNRAKKLQAQWKRRLQELRDFKNRHGHCNVPVSGEDGELGKFLMNQRYYYRTRLEQKNSLTPERIQDLEEVGIVWTVKGRKDGDKFLTNEEKWKRNVHELKKYKDEFGHVNVVKSGEYMELGQFVGNQRYFYRRRLRGETTSLTDDRIKILSDLGFEWKAPNKGGYGESKVYISSKVKGSRQVVEKDEDIIFPDESTIDHTTKESSQKRLVVIDDGSNVLETITKTHTTKVEKIVVPPLDGEERLVNNLHSKSPDLAGELNALETEKKVTYPDGSSVESTKEERTKKRLIVLEDGTNLLEMTTTTTITKNERSRIPDESGEISEAQRAEI